MNILQGVFIVVLLLEITACQGNGNCRSRPYAVEHGRRCRSPCAGPDAKCKATNKQCLCDGACGWSCFNPAATCAELEPITHGSFTVDNIMQGKATYSCDTGYIVNGTRKRTCYADKNWYPEAPTCLRGCDLPGNLGNAYPDTAKSSFAIDEDVKYKCRTGYYMSGYEYRTCRSSGWTSAQYTCHLQTCSSLSERVNHGSVDFTPGFYFGSTAKLTCDPGYEARDPWRIVTSIRCFAGENDSRYGEWTGELSSCEIKTCPPPMEPENGLIRGRSYVGRDYGTQITYECDLGFKLEGSDTGECDDDGSWGTMPNCTVDPDCDFDEFSHPTCGYEGDGWERIRVTEVDGLQGYASEATRRYSELTSAVIPSDWTTSDSICLKFNYKLEETDSSFRISPTDLHRNSDISWRSHSKEVKNTWLDSLLNIRTRNPIQYKFEVIDPTIQLDNIQVLEHACEDECKSRPCQNSGTCVSRSAGHTCFCTIAFRGSSCATDRRCSTPRKYATNAQLTNTHKIENMFLPSSTATYSCSKNYKFSAPGYYRSVTTSLKATCMESYGRYSSYWTQDIDNVECEEILCTNPPLRDNQQLVSETTRSNWRVGEKATVKCTDGYDFIEQFVMNYVTCGSNEQWIGQFTQCQDVRCPAADIVIPHGRRTGSTDDSWLYDATVTYECDTNYKFSGERNIVREKTATCKRKWNWYESYWDPDVNALECIAITCSKPAAGNHQYVPSYYEQKWTVGQRANYRCYKGYEFDSATPTTYKTCRDDETWDGAVTRCIEDIKCAVPSQTILHGNRTSLTQDPPFPPATVLYECEPGYKMKDEQGVAIRKTIVCTRRPGSALGSDWIPPASTVECIPITCSKPSTGQNQFIRDYTYGETWNIGEKANYGCDGGYEFESDNPTTYKTCRDDETWEGSVTSCVEDIKCSRPRFNISNGIRISLSQTPSFPNATATYQCRGGSKMKGEPGITDIKTIVCTEKKHPNLGSEWIPNDLTLKCIRIRCPPPNVGDSQELITSDKKRWLIGDVAEYRCQDGYEFNSPEPIIAITCRDDETWSAEPSECVGEVTSGEEGPSTEPQDLNNVTSATTTSIASSSSTRSSTTEPTPPATGSATTTTTTTQPRTTTTTTTPPATTTTTTPITTTTTTTTPITTTTTTIPPTTTTTTTTPTTITTTTPPPTTTTTTTKPTTTTTTTTPPTTTTTSTTSTTTTTTAVIRKPQLDLLILMPYLPNSQTSSLQPFKNFTKSIGAEMYSSRDVQIGLMLYRKLWSCYNGCRWYGEVKTIIPITKDQTSTSYQEDVDSITSFTFNGNYQQITSEALNTARSSLKRYGREQASKAILVVNHEYIYDRSGVASTVACSEYNGVHLIFLLAPTYLDNWKREQRTREMQPLPQQVSRRSSICMLTIPMQNDVHLRAVSFMHQFLKFEAYDAYSRWFIEQRSRLQNVVNDVVNEINRVSTRREDRPWCPPPGPNPYDGYHSCVWLLEKTGLSRQGDKTYLECYGDLWRYKECQSSRTWSILKQIPEHCAATSGEKKRRSSMEGSAPRRRTTITPAVTDPTTLITTTPPPTTTTTTTASSTAAGPMNHVKIMAPFTIEKDAVLQISPLNSSEVTPVVTANVSTLKVPGDISTLECDERPKPQLDLRILMPHVPNWDQTSLHQFKNFAKSVGRKLYSSRDVQISLALYRYRWVCPRKCYWDGEVHTKIPITRDQTSTSYENDVNSIAFVFSGGHAQISSQALNTARSSLERYGSSSATKAILVVIDDNIHFQDEVASTVACSEYSGVDLFFLLAPKSLYHWKRRTRTAEMKKVSPDRDGHRRWFLEKRSSLQNVVDDVVTEINRASTRKEDRESCYMPGFVYDSKTGVNCTVTTSGIGFPRTGDKVSKWCDGEIRGYMECLSSGSWSEWKDIPCTIARGRRKRRSLMEGWPWKTFGDNERRSEQNRRRRTRRNHDGDWGRGEDEGQQRWGFHDDDDEWGRDDDDERQRWSENHHDDDDEERRRSHHDDDDDDWGREDNEGQRRRRFHEDEWGADDDEERRRIHHYDEDSGWEEEDEHERRSHNDDDDEWGREYGGRRRWKPEGYATSHCRDPVLPDKAYIIKVPATYNQGTKVAIGCLGDNTLIGRNRIKCKASGQWTRTNAVCKANTCSVDAFTLPQSMLVDGESIYYETFRAGESITIECDDPFVLYRDPRRPPIIETEVTCNLGGRWSESLSSFSCDTGAFICACPNKPRNSSIVNDPNHYPVGITITLQCDPGFELIGEDTMTCLQTGHWDDARFRCEENIQDCEAPDLPDQAVIDDDPEEYPTGTTITLDCFGDNDLIGCPRMTCNQVGQWSECEFRCEANVCLLDRVLMPLRMGVEGYTSVEVYDHKFDIDEVATLECDGRQFPFLKDGGDFIQPDTTCQPGGRWKPNVYDFLCVTACETPTEPPNAHWVREPSSEAYRVGSRISFDCVDGWACEGDVGTVECQDDGEWSIPEDACIELALDCEAPDLPDQAIIEDDPEEYLPGTMITLDCIGDNNLIGCSRMTCNRFGQWSECESRCEANVCLLDRLLMPLGMGVEGYTSTEVYDHKFDIDEVATLACDGRRFPFLNDGGNFIQPDITCQPGGRWEPNAHDFHCDIACGTPTEPPNARWVREPSSDVYRVGNRIFFVCVDGCIYGGDVRTVECQDNGIWSIPEHACIEINECDPNPCRNGGRCTDLTNAFVCECVGGYSGKTCQIDVDDCDPDPCQNDGSCTDGDDDYSCLCPPGYTGKNCQTDINDCIPNPCRHGGLCFDTVNNYTCSCISGFVGRNCEKNIDECSSSPCMNDAECRDQVNGFNCSCQAGFTGDRCETDINDCVPNPCKNGGLCFDRVNNFSCACITGFAGKSCETNINDCSPNPCLNDARCTDQVNGFACSCQLGYTGHRCQTDVDDCSPNPCLNDAECTDLVNGYNCLCQPGYTGDRCQTDIDDCSPNPCLHGGRCTDGVDAFLCTCSPGYAGKTCGIDVDDCIPNRCLNGATCVDGANSYRCICSPGFIGSRCQINKNDCKSNPCKNGATCNDLVADFQCECSAGFTGKSCGTNINDCSPNPCLNGAGCTDQVNGFDCRCQPGYTGDRCQTDIDDCSPDPCLNEAECTDQVNGFSCSCQLGYTDARCQTDIDDCSPNPCLHDAECADEVNGFNCICQPGYTGGRCKTDIDDCSPNPCLNDAECADEVNGYNCICRPGYTGARCQTDIDDCSPNPCLNDAECTDQVNGYNCICQPGYTGDRCQTDIDDCSPNPCFNDAECTDQVNGYKCICQPGYTGDRCQTDIDDCSPNLCLNDAKCEDEVNGFNCICQPGYSGARCQTDIDDCNPNPCLNDAECADEVNGYHCICQPGYSGARCQTDVDDCSPNPCLNDAECIDQVNNFSCSCQIGYTGDRCQTDIDDCSPNPCLNDAECADEVNGFNCICQPGYIGDRCKTDIDDCSPNPCLNDAKCEDEVNGFNCICQPGYTGDRCQTDIDDCSPNPCLNDAECADEVNGYNCICQPGYTGARCQTDIDDCSPNPCFNDAECADEVNGYNCICQPGYSGARCQTDIDDCSPNPCLNDAGCADDVNGYNCICQPGYTGARCQTDIDDCSPNPCLNDAECSDKVNGFTCSCQPGYTGDQCQTDEDNCSPDPCWNDGTCCDLVNDFSCECPDGYAGKRCETNLKNCNPNPCRHVERCENLVNDFLCHCIPGYTGKRCEDEIDECAASPCINGGHCTDKVNDFECTCAAGHTGKTCAIDIDDCDPYPCRNNAKCEDGVNNFTCICDAGFTGRRCEKDINECLSWPCQNAGICINRRGTFLCECYPGSTGKLCEIELTTASTVSTRSSTTEPTPPLTPGSATTTTTTVDSIEYEYVDRER